jgi:ornithine decarboxylase
MTEAKFILSKKIVKEQVETLENLGLRVSYSYKTNHEVGNVLQEVCPDCEFSIHAFEEIEMIKEKNKIWFFTQAESEEELKSILEKGIRNFVIDNEIDLEKLLEVVREAGEKINLSLRMKFQEHRIGTGKYFVYGMSSKKVNELIEKVWGEKFIDKLGIHIHRKTQNTSEWEIKSEIEDSLTSENLERIDFVNLGGGLPSVYRGYTSKVLPYIFQKLKEVREFLEAKGIETYIEPGRFIAAPAVKLGTEIIQIQEKNVIINTTIYNCALDTAMTGTKMLVESELAPKGVPRDDSKGMSTRGNSDEEGEFYLVKGNSPTRDDIFRYKVKLENPQIGDKVVFLNAGAYNYTTDFFGYKKLKTEVVESC